MRSIRLLVLIAALSACVGASECSESGQGQLDAGTFKIAGVESNSDTNTETTTVDLREPSTPMPEPGSAALFGLGALIAAAAMRRQG